MEFSSVRSIARKAKGENAPGNNRIILQRPFERTSDFGLDLRSKRVFPFRLSRCFRNEESTNGTRIFRSFIKSRSSFQRDSISSDTPDILQTRTGDIPRGSGSPVDHVKRLRHYFWPIFDCSSIVDWIGRTFSTKRPFLYFPFVSRTKKIYMYTRDE